MWILGLKGLSIIPVSRLIIPTYNFSSSHCSLLTVTQEIHFKIPITDFV